MNYHRTIFVTHVELSLSRFIKIHGQTNREKAVKIEFSLPTVMNLFRTYPAPLLNMLDADTVVLVFHGQNYYRGKFISPGPAKTVTVLLIDMGYMVTVDLANVGNIIE